jgi:hypothetical protein
MLTCLAGNQLVNAVDPPPNHRYATAIRSTDGDIQNAPGVLGANCDGNYATMISYYVPANFPTTWTPPSNVAILVVEMNDLAIGDIAIHCWKPADPYPWFGMMIYTSNDLSNWNLVGTFWITDNVPQWRWITTVTEPDVPTPDPIEGYAPEPFRYMALAVMSTSPGINAYTYVDAISASPYVAPPLPPGYYQVTFNIRDTSGYLLPGNIYVNGVLIGRTSLTVYVSPQMPGPYQLYVTVDDTAHYVFQQYVDNIGGSTTNNPTPIYLTQPGIITAIFAPT